METIGMTAQLPGPALDIVLEFSRRVCNVGAASFIGVYLVGSISLHDFHLHKSDIDFLVLCKHLPNGYLAGMLGKIHKQLQERFPKPDLSGSYVLVKNLKHGIIDRERVLTCSKGKLHYEPLQMAPICLTELKANAITVVGDDTGSLPVLVEPDELNTFLHENMNSYWAAWVAQHSLAYRRKALLWLFPRLTEWCLLGMARQLCTLLTGHIVSKTRAGEFCLGYLPSKYHGIIQDAIHIRHDERTYPFVRTYAVRPSLARMAATLDCAEYIRTTFNKIYLESRASGNGRH